MSSSARSILASRKGLSLGIAFGVMGAIVTTPFIVGAFSFAALASKQLTVHFEVATGERARPSKLATFIALCAYAGAIAVMGGWVWFLEIVGLGLDRSSVPFELAILASPIIFALAAWVLAPFLFMAVAAVDPMAPTRVSDLFTCALNLTQEVPVIRRLAAIAFAALFLLSPVIGAVSLESSVARGVCVLMACGSIVFFLPVASALLVANYVPTRVGLNGFYSQSPRLPSGLLIYTSIGIAVSVTAAAITPHWYHDDTAMALSGLALLWFFIVLAFFGFWRAHRLRRLDAMGEDAPPGRYALEVELRQAPGSAWPAESRLVAGPLSFRVPPDTRGPLGASLKDGARLTLLGNFKPAHASFRQSAEHAWPGKAVVFSGTPDQLVKRMVERAAWLAYAAVTLSGVISAVLLFG